MPRKCQIDLSKRGKFNERLEQVQLVATDQLSAEFNIPPEQSDQIVSFVLSVFQEQLGGEGMYFSKGHLWHLSQRDLRLYKRFTGNNHIQLKNEFGVSIRRVYYIIKRVQEEEFEKRQLKMFE